MSKSPTWAQAHRLEKELGLDRETVELLLRNRDAFAGFAEQIRLGTYRKLKVESFRYPDGYSLLWSLYHLCGIHLTECEWSHAKCMGRLGYLKGINRGKLGDELRRLGFSVTSGLGEYENDPEKVFLEYIPEVRICVPSRDNVTSLSHIATKATTFSEDGLRFQYGHLVGLDAAMALMVARQDLLCRDRVLAVDYNQETDEVWTIDWVGRKVPILQSVSRASHVVCASRQNVQYAALKCIERVRRTTVHVS